MRKLWLVPVAVAIAVPAGIVATQTAGAAGGTVCGKGAGSATFNPPVYKLQPAATQEQHEATSTIKSTGTVGSCVGGGVKSGKTTATIKIADPTNCNGVLTDKDTAVPATTGPLVITWNTGAKSTIKAKLTAVANQPTQTNVSGPVTAGLFKGKKLTARLAYKATSNDQCATASLKKVTYTGASGTKFKIA